MINDIESSCPKVITNRNEMIVSLSVLLYDNIVFSNAINLYIKEILTKNNLTIMFNIKFNTLDI
jgi:hypothetical protein